MPRPLALLPPEDFELLVLENDVDGSHFSFLSAAFCFSFSMSIKYLKRYPEIKAAVSIIKNKMSSSNDAIFYFTNSFAFFPRPATPCRAVPCHA